MSDMRDLITRKIFPKVPECLTLDKFASLMPELKNVAGSPCLVVEPKNVSVDEKGPLAVIVYMHDTDRTLADDVDVVKHIADATNCMVFAPEFPGYGGCEGVATEHTVELRLLSVLDFLAARGCPSQNVVIMGHGYASGVVFDVGVTRTFLAVVSLGGFSTLDLSKWTSLCPGLTKGRYNNKARVKFISSPIVLHSRSDEKFSFENIESLMTEIKLDRKHTAGSNIIVSALSHNTTYKMVSEIKPLLIGNARGLPKNPTDFSDIPHFVAPSMSCNCHGVPNIGNRGDMMDLFVSTKDTLCKSLSSLFF
jgi:hypothetical protein